MTAITGHLSAAEVDDAMYAVHFWAGDMQNHRYRREQLGDPAQGLKEPQCTQGRGTPATKHAYRRELSEELGADRDHARDCHPCFSTRRRGGV